MKAYITIRSSGAWEDYHEFIDKVFLHKNKAEKYVGNYNNNLENKAKKIIEEMEKLKDNDEEHEKYCELECKLYDLSEEHNMRLEVEEITE